uniref:Retrovirus-related Pol polyprotein from transposon TNT 1-94 n=1 Tax=Tanacetum cinerariifolium TaxID=118510 RepID=A0A699HF25_TANCI|nr:retrovirus-related Pol polyprotein from transposon TNT 1-94 [Tanacetum cinerariifolium]
MAFVFTDNTSSTNDVITAYSVSSPSVSKSQKEGSASYTDEVIHSSFANQSSAPQQDCDDLEQINDDDLKEMDLKWQFDTRDTVGFDKTKVECFNCHKIGHFARDCRAKWKQDSRRRDGGYNGNKARDNSKRPAYQDDLKALVTIDEEAIKNYMPSGPEVEIDYSKFTYGLKQTSADESDSKPVNFASSDSDSKYESDSDDDSVSLVQENIEKPSVSFTDSVKHVKSPRKIVKETGTPNNYPKIEKQDKHSHTRKGLGYARKSCFVCGSFSHLIRDCEFHEKRMSKQAALTKSEEKDTGQQAHRPVWNNVKRVNHQNKFVPSVLLTKTGKIPINAARQNFSRQAALTSTARKVNTARPFMNETRPKRCFYKSLSPHKRPFHNKTTQRNTFTNNKVNTVNTSLSTVKGNWDTAVKASACCNWRNKRNTWNKVFKYNSGSKIRISDDPHKALKDKGIVDSGCSKHTTWNKAYLADYQEFKCGSVAFGGSNGKITGKGKIKAGRLDFEDVYYVEELKHYNLFYVSQMCDKKNKVLVTDTDCRMLSPDFKLPDKNEVLLKIPRQHNMYSFNLKNIDPYGDLSCLFVKASIDKSNKWHRRLGHVNFKNLNKLVKGNLVRVLPSKIFKNDHTCVACQKGKQHKASWIKREYSNAKTLQQNRVTERKNRTLIEAARTMLADLFLPTTFWAEAVNTACYVLNRVLVTKPQNKTPYELLTGRQPIISYLRPFGCHVTIMNTIDQLGKFDGKSDSGFLVGYSLNSKAFKEELEKLKRQENEANDAVRKEATHETQDVNTNNTNLRNAISTPVSVVSPSRALNDDEHLYPHDPSMPYLEDSYVSPSVGIYTDSSYDDEDVQTRSKVHKNFEARALISQALEGKSCVDAMQEELLQFQIQNVWFLVDLAFRKKAVGTKWVYMIKKDEKGVVVRNKARLVAQGHRQEEWIDYDEVLLIAFLYGTINEEVYVTQPPGFVNPKFPNKVYKVVKALYELHKAPRACVKTASTPIETQKPLVKDEEAADVDVTPKTSHLQAVNRIFRYLKGQPKLGLWYPKVSSFNLEAYSDSDYAGANLDRKSTTGVALLKGRLLEDTTTKNRLQLSSIAKPTESDEFKQIIDFLNGSSVRYALTASLTIRTSCIKQFWSTAKVKTVNDEVKVQALIDEKRCLSAKTTSWNEFRSTMTSTLIYLAINQKFNFSRYILLSLVKNIEAEVPFYMFPRFVQLIIDHQLGDMSHHQDIYDNPSLTKKVFSNMKRVGTGFSRVITPLFENMLVSAAEEVGQAQDDVSIPVEPSTSKLHTKHKSKKQQPIAPKVSSLEPSPEHQLPSPSNDLIPDADKDRLKLQELMDLCIRLSNKVLDLESKVIDIKISFTDKIEKLEDRVHKLEKENRILKEKSFKSSKMDIVTPVEDKEESFKQGKMIADMDEDVEVNLEETQAKAYNLELQHSEKVLSIHDINEEELAEVEEVLEVVTATKLMTAVVTTTKPTTVAAQVPKVSDPRRKRGVVIQDPEETTTSVIVHTELEAELNANINWNDVIDQVKRSKRQNNEVMRYQALKRKPLTEAQTRKNMMIYLKNIAGFKMNFFKGMTYSEIRPLFEKHYNLIQAFLEKGEEEVTLQEKEIKEDDNKRQATPLASKVPVVDYQIHHENNKPYYKIIRADGTHKLFLSFITLLKNFNREDLETLWKLVKERFETTKPKNFSEDFLLNILRIMFEKPNIEANVWKEQKGIYGLAKKYPLTHLTLEQMLNNVRLEVEEESEMSLELLRLVTRQLNEGYVPE